MTKHVTIASIIVLAAFLCVGQPVLCENIGISIKDSVEAKQSPKSVVASESVLLDHTSYRGRDWGAVQAALTQSLTYRHSSGVSVYGRSALISNAEYMWRGTTLGFTYSRSLPKNENVWIEAGYSYFFYNAKDPIARSMLTNAFESAISYSLGNGSIGASGSIAWSDITQRTLEISAEYVLTLSSKRSLKSFFLSPRCNVVWGNDVEYCTMATIKRTEGIDEVIVENRTSSGAFGIMAYEAQLPLSMESGGFSLTIAALLVYPVRLTYTNSSNPFLTPQLTFRYYTHL